MGAQDVAAAGPAGRLAVHGDVLPAGRVAAGQPGPDSPVEVVGVKVPGAGERALAAGILPLLNPTAWLSRCRRRRPNWVMADGLECPAGMATRHDAGTGTNEYWRPRRPRGSFNSPDRSIQRRLREPLERGDDPIPG